MERKELDEKILAAITTLKSEGKSLTVINIKEITGFLKYQIYTSKHKDQLEIRGREARAIQKAKVIQRATEILSIGENFDKSLNAKTLVAATPGHLKAGNIDLLYQLSDATLKIEIKEATADKIDDAIEELNFLFRKSIERLEREKSKLH
jgi:hypothetical protein